MLAGNNPAPTPSTLSTSPRFEESFGRSASTVAGQMAALIKTLVWTITGRNLDSQS